MYVEWSARPLAQLIVHANNETDEVDDERVIPTNQPYQVPEFEDLPWYWEYEGHIAIGLSLSANGSNPYEFGRTIPVDTLEKSVQDGCIHLYFVWSDSAIRGYIYANFDGAKPESISTVIMEDSNMQLPGAEAIGGMWDYNGTPLGYSTEEDGDVEYQLGGTISYNQVNAVDGHCLYIIWQVAPVSYTVQYLLYDIMAGTAEELGTGVFSSNDDTYTIIGAPDGYENYAVMTEGGESFEWEQEVEVETLIGLTSDGVLYLMVLDASLLQ